MGVFRRRAQDERIAQRKRNRVVKTVLLVALLLIAGALLDPSLISPFGPTATRPEQISALFTRCDQGTSLACVADGATIRLGQREVRLLGIDAPGIANARCPAERALGERAANRLLALVNNGPFDLVGHRFEVTDRAGRDLRVLVRDHVSFASVLTHEGLARRSYGRPAKWC